MRAGLNIDETVKGKQEIWKGQISDNADIVDPNYMEGSIRSFVVHRAEMHGIMRNGSIVKDIYVRSTGYCEEIGRYSPS